MGSPRIDCIRGVRDLLPVDGFSMSLFNASDHARLATLFDGVWTPDGTTWAGPYPGYKPEVREAPNGDTKACPWCEENRGACVDPGEVCETCDGTGRVPNVDAGPAGKRYLHVAPKYNPPAWAVEYLARAHYEACRVAEALGVPPEYYPRVADGTLRVLEYPSAGHPYENTIDGSRCTACGEWYDRETSEVCPALAPGAGTVEHTDPDLFTIVLWRSTPLDLELADHRTAPTAADCDRLADGRRMSPGLHIGEIGELVGLGPATPHSVPARPYPQRSIVYFAVPDHGAELPDGRPQGIHGARTPTTVGAWLAERLKRSRYT